MDVIHSRLVVLAGLLVSVPVIAETDYSSTDSSAVDTIVVTATKVEKDSLDVPFGLTVLSGKDLDNKNIHSIEGVIGNTANTDIVTSGDGRANSTTIKIRGMGPLGGAANAEDTSVVVYVDGIPVPASAIANGYFDVQRIEVLKGPQGTLFGRNSAGGAINIVTPTPSDETELSVRAQGGENNHHRVSAVVSGAIAQDKLYGRLLVASQEDGAYIENQDANDLGGVKKELARATLFFTPSDITDIKLTLSAERDRRSFVSFGARRDDAGDKLVVGTDLDNEVGKDAYGVGLTINHELDSFNFTSATGYHDISINSYTDGLENNLARAVFGVNPVTTSDWDEDHKTFSQELRLSSHADSYADWVTGLSYYNSQFKSLYNDNYKFPFPFSVNGQRDLKLTSESYSWFGEATLPVSDTLDLVAGLRYTNDKKTEELKFKNNNNSVGLVDSAHRQHDLSDNFVTGRASIIYKMDPRSRVFATVSRGHKTGGFQQYSDSIAIGSTADESYESSQVNAFELGYKHRSQDGTFSISNSIFYNDIEDEQVFNFDGVSGALTILNADARTMGAELESAFQLTEAWQLAANLGYLDTELRNISNQFTKLTGGKNGNELPGVAKWSGGISVDYRDRAPWINDNVELFGVFSWQYTGSRQADIANSFKLRKFNNVNVKFGASVNDQLEIYGFINNLLDNYQEQFGTNFGGPVVAIGRNRVAGLGMSYQL